MCREGMAHSRMLPDKAELGLGLSSWPAWLQLGGHQLRAGQLEALPAPEFVFPLEELPVLGSWLAPRAGGGRETSISAL